MLRRGSVLQFVLLHHPSPTQEEEEVTSTSHMKRMQVVENTYLHGPFFVRLIGFDFFLLLCCCDSFPHLFSSFGVLSFYTLVGAWPGLLIYSIMAACTASTSVKDVRNIREGESQKHGHICVFLCLQPCGSSPQCRTAEDSLIRW